MEKMETKEFNSKQVMMINDNKDKYQTTRIASHLKRQLEQIAIVY